MAHSKRIKNSTMKQYVVINGTKACACIHDDDDNARKQYEFEYVDDGWK